LKQVALVYTTVLFPEEFPDYTMSKKDMRRADLGMQIAADGLKKPHLMTRVSTDLLVVVPYVEPEKDEKSSDLGSE
jgi:hypothetical protein